MYSTFPDTSQPIVVRFAKKLATGAGRIEIVNESLTPPNGLALVIANERLPTVAAGSTVIFNVKVVSLSIVVELIVTSAIAFTLDTPLKKPFPLTTKSDVVPK